MFKVTCIDLDNGEFALYINGHYLTSEDGSGEKMYAGDLLERLACIPGVVVEHAERDVPDNEDWCWNDIADSVFSPATGVWGDVTVGALIQRLQTYSPAELCVGVFWLADDFLSLDDTLQEDEIHQAMQIAEKHHDCNYGYNWDYLKSCIEFIKDGD
ncbi:hypothetical protein ACI2I2_24260 [Scandinavium sp. NPDC088450]|uniref:hypothetical protein n=1 Tax=Scandinavium sp. NPDC088450 TaxID=3364514 RepID=UPI0038501D03